MKILFITGVLPHARVLGGAIIVHNRIKLLAERGYEIGLASFVSPAEEPYVAELRPMLSELETLPAPPAMTAWRAVRSLLCSPVPPPISAYAHPDMHRLVGNMIQRSRYDVAIAEFSGMGQYLHWNVHLPAVRRIISVHSCVTCALQKAAALQPWSLAGLRKRILLPRLQRFEFLMYRSADLILTLTGEERVDMLSYAPDLHIAVIPYGVDVERYCPRPDQPTEEAIVFTGVYRDEPNRDAVRWFVQQAWPTLHARHPDLKFYIVGSGVTRDVQDLARRYPNVIVTGEVPDVSPYLARCRAYVCPMRIGTGFRGKILQAMAAGLPVVSTTQSAEGIPAATGNNILLADTPRLFANSISLLLQDEELRQRIAHNARELVVRRFAWSHCVDVLEQAIKTTLR